MSRFVLTAQARLDLLNIWNYIAQDNIDAADKSGSMPLHLASAYGHLDIVRLLVSQSADLQAEDFNGNTALDVARANNHLELVKLLGPLTSNQEAR